MNKRRVWKVIPKPSGRVMDTKWVFKRKLEPDGTLRHKARLCARGYKDTNEYIYGNEIYSPTAKLRTVRLLMILVVERN